MENEKDKGKGMMLIIIIMLGVIIVAIVAGAVFLLTSDFGNGGEMQIVIIEQPAISEQDIRAVTLSSDITTNLLSHDGARHVVRVTVGVGINNTNESEADDFISMLLEREIVMKDIATNILRRTTREQLAVVGGTEAVADEILEALQDAFGSQLIVRVYLGNLVTS